MWLLLFREIQLWMASNCSRGSLKQWWPTIKATNVGYGIKKLLPRRVKKVTKVYRSVRIFIRTSCKLQQNAVGQIWIVAKSKILQFLQLSRPLQVEADLRHSLIGPSSNCLLLFFLKKIGQSRPLFVYFRSFHIPIPITNIQFEQYRKKHRLCAWDSKYSKLWLVGAVAFSSVASSVPTILRGPGFESQDHHLRFFKFVLLKL